MRLFSFIILLSTVCYGNAYAQPVWSNDITSRNPGLTNPYTTGQVVSPNITVSGIGHSPAISGTVGDDLYNTNLWSSSTVLDTNRYLYFTLTPVAGYRLNLLNFTYSSQRSNAGPRSFAFRSSLDGFTNNIAAPGATGGIINLEMFQGITTPVTFRLYAYDAADALGTFGVMDFQFMGSVPLPVTFGSIVAALDKEGLKVQWSTESETNNDHFDIELSGNGRHFKKIYSQISKADGGNSSYRLRYEAIIALDNLTIASVWLMMLVLGTGALVVLKKRNIFPLLICVIVLIGIACTRNSNNSYDYKDNSPYYLRIAQIDKDGSVSYSKIVRVMHKLN